ncbi:hypothetical protein CY35_17G073500 [Sphagnum magellanicum]|nr:hypothetical protein CY35_17G073500 [Sphagnum magellanicum]
MEVSSMGICHGEPSSFLPAMSMVKGEQQQTSLASLHWLLSSNSCLGGSRSSSCSFRRKFSVPRRLQAAAGYFPVWSGVVISCENLPIVVQGNQSQGRSPRAIQWGIQSGTLLDFQTHQRARIGGYKPHALPTTPATQPASAQEILEQWRLEKELQSLKDLNKQLQEASNLEERMTIIDRSNKHVHRTIIESITQSLQSLVQMLERMDRFYDSIGGIIGYQVAALELIKAYEQEQELCLSKLLLAERTTGQHSRKQFLVPVGPDLAKDKEYAIRAASWGLERLPEMAEIYPLGGAGDRLGLVDPVTGECLPVAMLPYCGRTLLEGLIRDLQAREFLYYKVYGRQHITPVAIMTSAAKKNNERVQALCESHGWFGRGKQSFRLFEQPLVPTVSAADGRWMVSQPLGLVLKPGGHGVIWKLASDEGVFAWFSGWERKAAIVRQISNPVAGTDVTLLALSGIGRQYNKKFGFASCTRNVGAAEGVNVLTEQSRGDGSWEYAISCIEYTEFSKLGITDVPVAPGSGEAQFPANTNVLYVDLASVEQIASSKTAATLPGMVMNLKKPTIYNDHHGIKHSVRGGRIECTMQNVADQLVTRQPSRLTSESHEDLDTFIVFNERRKVTSSAKRHRKMKDDLLHQTPDGSFLDVTRNGFELLTSCGVQMPKMESNHCYVDSWPPFIVLLHPAMGPLWDITRQKIRGGSMAEGSELVLEVAEFSWLDVELKGSLLVKATNVMGSLRQSEPGSEKTLDYGVGCARCRLHGVQILNKSVDWTCSSNVYWQHKVQRLEALEIILQDNAEFEAFNVTFEGSHRFEVPSGHRMRITEGPSDAGLSCSLEPISGDASMLGTWHWHYKVDEVGQVCLTMVEL